MALPSLLCALLLYGGGAVASVWTGIDHDADPYIIGFADGDSIGPDGPWWYIKQAIDFPDQNVSMVPSVSRTSLAINASACSAQEATCPLPLPTMWTTSGAYQVSDGPNTQSNVFDSATWDADYAALLRMDGSGAYFADRVTLHHNGTDEQAAFLDMHGMGISQNYTVTYPGGAEYTMNVGFLSLYGAEAEVEWEILNGTSYSSNRTLPDAYTAGYIPSISYGLHLGSVNPEVTGSLTLGGYDSSRCLTEPIVSNSESLQLLDIALNVSTGGYAYLEASSGLTTGLLQANGSQAEEIEVYPRPGTPYMYLPKDTCDAIATHLPVTYNEDFNLYFWNTSDQAYEDIIGSPHFLAFTFATDNGQNSTINVPFAVLKLTLESPLISTPTQYFPCSPLEPADTGYTLGSAFLQAVFLAQNWQTGKLYLAQAPGPDFLSPNIKKIAYTDTTLVPATNPPDWESTWSATLNALPATASSGSNSSSSDGGNTSQSPSSSSSSSSLSGGAIAGIVVGAVVGIALIAALLFFLLRRRKKTAYHPAPQHPGPSPSIPPGYSSPQPYHEARHEAEPTYEVEAKPPTSEMDATGEVLELPADEQTARGKYK